MRKLTTRTQLLALLYGQLAGAESLRDIVGAFESHASRLYHLGAGKASRSTLSDANSLRSPDVFAGLFSRLVAQALPGFRKAMRESVHLIEFDQFPAERALRRLGRLFGQSLRREAACRL